MKELGADEDDEVIHKKGRGGRHEMTFIFFVTFCSSWPLFFLVAFFSRIRAVLIAALSPTPLYHPRSAHEQRVCG